MALRVHGRVVDENGRPLQGVTVTVKGTKKQTITDDNGEFVLPQVETNAILSFSSVNMDTFNLSVSGRTEVFATLKTKMSQLDDVQIIGYGKTTKRFLTGNVSTIKSQTIETQPVGNPLLALEGRVPGMVITQATGLPGSGVAVRIQGQNTIGINIGSDPLYIVDGMPYPSRLLYTISRIQGSSGNNSPNQAGVQAGTGNPLSFINPSDIESIEVLKDADATAIYGSRAGNGAIIITTKKGVAGKTKVDFKMQSGWAKVTRMLDVLNRDQYLEMRNEAIKNDNITLSPTDNNYDLNGTWDNTRETNWQKELIGNTARYSDIQSSFSGGNTNTQFLISSSYHKETTVFPGNSNDKKGSLHFNINNISSNSKFKLQLSGSYLIDNNNLINRDLTQDAISLSPVAPSLYNADGSLNWAPLSNGNSTWTNPLAYLDNTYNAKTNNLIGNAVISYKILSRLHIMANLGYNNLQMNQTLLAPLTSVRPEIRPTTLRSSQFSNSNMNSWVAEPQINFQPFFGNVKVETLLGATFQQNNSSRAEQSGSGYNSDLVLKDISAAPTRSAIGGSAVYKYNAIFGRVNISYKDKYLLNFTGRRDGSSRFGSENRFHNFGAIGAAWIFSSENILKASRSFLSFGKLRASYGTTGNDQIGDYQYLNLYNPVTGVGVPYQSATGLAPDRLANPYLQWEETRKIQFGVDLSFNNDRIIFTTNYYNNRSSNQLLSYSLPIATGFSGITTNFPALIENSGWEFSLTSTNINQKNFKWTTSFNLTFPKNKLLEFPNLSTSSYASQLVIGQSVNVAKAYRSANTDVSGVYQFIDSSGNFTTSPVYPRDATVLISTDPKFYGGLENTLSYKGFELAVFFQFVKQIGYNYFFGNNPGNFFGTTNNGNQPVSVLERWQKPGDNKPIQRYYYNFNISNFLGYYNAIASNAAYSDASFIRLKNLSLSWNVPKPWLKSIHIDNARFFVFGQNLLTITNYQGMDPETRSYSTLPPLKVITVGVQVAL
ncbi:hypothetical protein A4D02_09350 [Niastella koreensis]|uniref:TonB-dependent receptor plug domain-containing protein n=1 Tax=Niastella koreensis TaxID=354356 RepID=A0ABX3NUA7_9BACT|nr:hypothetical protein A4D02_09350 [Niastella koreensis]